MVVDLQYDVIRNVAMSEDEHIGLSHSVMLHDEFVVLFAELFLCAHGIGNIGIDGVQALVPVERLNERDRAISSIDRRRPP